jgi:hypothetical protein
MSEPEGTNAISGNVLSVVNPDTPFVRAEGGDGEVGGQTAPAPEATSGDIASAAEAVAAEAGVTGDDPLAYVESLLAEPEAPEEPGFDDDLEIPEEDKDKPIGRAARTIRDLRKRAQAAEQQNQQFQQQMQQNRAWMDDMARRYQFLEERLSRPQVPEQPQQREPVLDPNDPQYALKKFQQEQREAWRQDFEELRRQDREEIQSLKQALQQQEQTRQTAQVSQRYNMVADASAAQLTNGFAPEVAQKMNRALGTLVLNAAYGWKTDPRSAAVVLDRLMTDYGMAKLRARHASSKKQIQTSQQVPTAPIPGRGVPNARGDTLPTKAEVEAAGAKDSLDLMFKRSGFRRAK